MRKIDYAIAAASVFIQHLHREGFDRGMIASFGDSYRVEQSFTGREASLHSALQRLAGQARDRSTHLYDALENVIGTFWESGDRRRPWLLIVVTDGQDNVSSSKYRNNPAAIGQYIATRYNHENSNFIFVIGVGTGNQIDVKALATLGSTGRFPVVTIDAFPLLEAVFLEIAINVAASVTGRRISAGGVSWDRVEQSILVSQVPFDYAFLIDRSASMTEPG